MIKNVYVLYHQNPNSIQYKNECVESMKPYPELNVIELEGYSEVHPEVICRDFGVRLHPYYQHQMDNPKAGPHSPEFLKRSFSGAGGHYKFWAEVVKSNEPGIVLEHDVVVKGPMSDLEVADGELLWLAPRIKYEDDYTYPDGIKHTYLDVDRWEGASGYAITPTTAQMLLDGLKKYGINDSADGALGMRNMFDIKFLAVDPPPAVSVLADKKSTTEESTVPAFWNAINTPLLLKNMRPGADIPQERRVIYTDTKFDARKKDIVKILKKFNKRPTDKLHIGIVNANEGYEANWFNNNYMLHDDSAMVIFNTPEKSQLSNFNLYFSKFYHRNQYISIPDNYPTLIRIADQTDFKFDIIYCNVNDKPGDTLNNGPVCWNLLADDGVLIVDNHGREATKLVSRLAYPDKSLLYNPNFVVVQKEE
jgi:GR25 family glycosyltransferase involved in LPS biosynthesis